MRIIGSFILMFYVNCVLSQGVSIYQKYKDDILFIRWHVTDVEQWSQSINEGFTLEQTNLRTKETITYDIKNKTLPYLSLGPDSEDPRFMASFLLNPAEVEPELWEETFPAAEFDSLTLNVARKDLTDLILNSSFDLIEESGFGIQLKDLNKEDEYNFKIKSAQGISAQFKFKVSDYTHPALPPLEAKWSNRQVKLKWNTKNFKDYFYGYQVSFSKDGAPFQILDTLIINPLDSSKFAPFHFIENSVFLEDNKSIYTFRIIGKDFLGGQTTYFSEATGQGNEGIGLSPLITNSEQLKTNEVKLAWSLVEKYSKNVKEWRIYVSRTWDGPYEMDSTGIESNTRETVRPIPYEDSYFRIVALDFNYDEYSSFPQLVVNLDTIPPAVPSQITGNIDSLGVVTLKWGANSEPDFYGYKIFYGFDTTKEMTLANFKAIPNPFFQDTIGLHALNRNLYYKITAVDKRNNRSEFSEILKLVKPDVIPPVEPNFFQYKSGPGTTSLSWFPSPSLDVVNQKLFRRRIAVENEWTLIKEWDQENIAFQYIDSNLLAFEKYAYTLTVEDDSGNISPPSSPAIVTILPKHTQIDINSWKFTRNKDGFAEFTHKYDSLEIEEIRLYEVKQNGQVFEIAKLQPLQKTYVIKNNSTSNECQIFIQILYKDGSKSQYSTKKKI